MLQILDGIIRSACFISASVVGIRYKVINSMPWLWVCRVDSWSAVGKKSSSQHINPDGHLQVRPGCCFGMSPASRDAFLIPAGHRQHAHTQADNWQTNMQHSGNTFVRKEPGKHKQKRRKGTAGDLFNLNRWHFLFQFQRCVRRWIHAHDLSSRSGIGVKKTTSLSSYYYINILKMRQRHVRISGKTRSSRVNYKECGYLYFTWVFFLLFYTSTFGSKYCDFVKGGDFWRQTMSETEVFISARCIKEN